jgi:hypothetical protein
MKKLSYLLFVFAALFAPVCVVSAAPQSIGYFDSINQEAAPVVGEQYYMRHCLRYEPGDEWPTTNYSTDKSVLLPINTRVMLVALKGKSMSLKIEKTGEILVIENVSKYSQKEMGVIAKNMLTRTPVPIESFAEDMAKNIRNGVLTVGMTKEQVIMTRGYPPAHKTPSLEMDQWRYWRNRVVNHACIFRDGVLIDTGGN